MPNEQMREHEREQERREEHREDRREDRREEHREERREEHHEERREERREDSTTTPVFHPNGPTRILLSPGTGAGWVSYAPHGASDVFLGWMLTYNPMIRALEAREHKDRLEEIVKKFHEEAHHKYNVERLVVARVGDIVVRTVDGPFEIHENNGCERVEHVGDVGHRRVIHL